MCHFEADVEFQVEMSPFLLQVLNLSNTTKSNTAVDSVKLIAAIRPFLNVHCNAAAPHYVNSDEFSIMRVISNNAQLNEKVMLSFPHAHYYPVGRR